MSVLNSENMQDVEKELLLNYNFLKVTAKVNKNNSDLRDVYGIVLVNNRKVVRFQHNKITPKQLFNIVSAYKLKDIDKVAIIRQPSKNIYTIIKDTKVYVQTTYKRCIQELHDNYDCVTLDSLQSTWTHFSLSDEHINKLISNTAKDKKAELEVFTSIESQKLEDAEQSENIIANEKAFKLYLEESGLYLTEAKANWFNDGALQLKYIKLQDEIDFVEMTNGKSEEEIIEAFISTFGEGFRYFMKEKNLGLTEAKELWDKQGEVTHHRYEKKAENEKAKQPATVEEVEAYEQINPGFKLFIRTVQDAEKKTIRILSNEWLTLTGSERLSYSARAKKQMKEEAKQTKLDMVVTELEQLQKENPGFKTYVEEFPVALPIGEIKLVWDKISQKEKDNYNNEALYLNTELNEYFSEENFEMAAELGQVDLLLNAIGDIKKFYKDHYVGMTEETYKRAIRESTFDDVSTEILKNEKTLEEAKYFREVANKYVTIEEFKEEVKNSGFKTAKVVIEALIEEGCLTIAEFNKYFTNGVFKHYMTEEEFNRNIRQGNVESANRAFIDMEDYYKENKEYFESLKDFRKRVKATSFSTVQTVIEVEKGVKPVKEEAKVEEVFGTEDKEELVPALLRVVYKDGVLTTEVLDDPDGVLKLIPTKVEDSITDVVKVLRDSKAEIEVLDAAVKQKQKEFNKVKDELATTQSRLDKARNKRKRMLETL